MNKIIFWISIAIIIIWMIIALFGKIIPLEIKIGNPGDFHQLFVFYALQTAVLFTMFGTLKRKDSKKLLIGKVILTCIVAAAACFLTFITVFAGMCAWSTDQVLMEKKDSPDTRIVLRRKSCGSPQGTLPQYKTSKVKYITSRLFWIKDIDTNTIDKKQWIRIK
ncbi:hypothetical protein [Pedobacter lusitanus]|uniref:hypothetical protein n=1 Tax=Pedobacter lusitanus TaxID=1503925 RepID=UPI001364B2DC|nr:hypothetical protein [Pedobacter lusitanus]